MSLDTRAEDARPPTRRVAFQLSQLGSLASARFADRVAELGLQPSDIGLLRIIAGDPGLSQQSLAGRLGVVPSRVVALIDGLERKGLVERSRSTIDRRNYELRLAQNGADAMSEMRRIGAAHEADFLSPLSADERRSLGTLLTKLAEHYGLDAEVHPGYRSSHG
ncbi:MarR family winged helix-turn-helix transcriptional regulator [Agromyces laixinhei]|uniref:MarR family winged helix-turn-helix transcriptional regulator n=1 Tax=Agromyces laixinhei TaxID=2585717 RepID=UPI0011161AF9|nr:MarR family transcriptional regulator [Agromyces laixinhei]